MLLTKLPLLLNFFTSISSSMQGIQTVNVKLYDYVESIPSMEVCSQLLTSYFDMSVCVCVCLI